MCDAVPCILHRPSLGSRAKKLPLADDSEDASSFDGHYTDSDENAGGCERTDACLARDPAKRSASPPSSAATSETSDQGLSDSEDSDYLEPLRKLKMVQSLAAASQKGPKPGLKSFSIEEILSYAPDGPPATEVPAKIVRPWDLDGERASRKKSKLPDDARGQKCRPQEGKSTASAYCSSPLDALFQMTNKTFEGLKKECGDKSKEHLSMFENRQQPKKKRKSRTAFTNHQVFELEKRFLYQKYLTPADRDEIASHLGLTKAQVITWFQNRRAKLKRDMEELKKDVQTASFISSQKAYMENFRSFNFSKELEWVKTRMSCEELDFKKSDPDVCVSRPTSVSKG